MQNSSGGLVYHLRALRYRRRLWTPYLSWVKNNLETWTLANKHNKTLDHLVLVGASGGWALPTDFLRRFARISIYDLDVLAKMIFQKNHPLKDVTWHHQDFFARDGSALQKHAHNNQIILFCNVLGQLGVVYRRAWTQHLLLEDSFCQNLRSFLADQEHWASFHDVFSFSATAMAPAAALNAAPTLEAFHQKYPITGTVVDHLTERYFKESHRELLPWRFSPSRVHLLGWQMQRQI